MELAFRIFVALLGPARKGKLLPDKSTHIIWARPQVLRQLFLVDPLTAVDAHFFKEVCSLGQGLPGKALLPPRSAVPMTIASMALSSWISRKTTWYGCSITVIPKTTEVADHPKFVGAFVFTIDLYLPTGPITPL